MFHTNSSSRYVRNKLIQLFIKSKQTEEDVLYRELFENPSSRDYGKERKKLIDDEYTTLPSTMPVSLLPEDDFGFIITRHVMSQTTNKYWIHCIRCIRRHYPLTRIIIIDDNSNKKYIENPEADLLQNCEIVYSEFPKRGELLGYYYLYTKRYFKKAMIIHDSLFVKQYISDIENIHDCKFLFHCTHQWDDDAIILKCLQTSLPNSKTIIPAFFQKDKWFLCFGVQSVITLEFLNRLQNHYQFFNLLKCITSRDRRMALERIFGLLCTLEKPELGQDPSIFGNIHDYMEWGYSYNNYVKDITRMHLGNSQVLQKIQRLQVIKVWTGR